MVLRLLHPLIQFIFPVSGELGMSIMQTEQRGKASVTMYRPLNLCMNFAIQHCLYACTFIAYGKSITWFDHQLGTYAHVGDAYLLWLPV